VAHPEPDSIEFVFWVVIVVGLIGLACLLAMALALVWKTWRRR
jgi:hypothetical protein